jgi:lipoprotein-anchoring transpeptidase ErfK/SrfK
VKALGWLLSLTVWVVPSFGQEAPAKGVSLRSKRQVLVSIPDRKLAVMEDGFAIRTFSVSVGATGSPSPTGVFEIVNRLAEPAYYHAGVVIPPGSHNPLGPRWVGLNKKGYGIHGTNVPASVGRAASHGCIRLRNRDIVEFAKLVNIGDTVEIRGERDPDTARIFGPDSVVTVALTQGQQPVLTAGSGQ